LIRSDGSFVRDYFYVRDAVEAYLLLAEQVPNEGVVGEAFNFGTETPLSVIDVANRVLETMDRRDLELTVLNEAQHEIPKQFLDCTKAGRVLGWKPGRTLEEGLADTIAWYRQHVLG
jgi:CDP-glucose 4,6-dehydratase